MQQSVTMAEVTFGVVQARDSEIRVFDSDGQNPQITVVQTLDVLSCDSFRSACVHQ